MEKIQKYNCEGMCAEETCSNKYTRFEIIKENGMDVHISLCDKHAEQWENYKYKIKKADESVRKIFNLD